MHPIECLNRIELAGYVGSIHRNNSQEILTVHFTLAVNRCYRDSQNTPIIETQWFSVIAFGNAVAGTEDIVKGSPVHVIGRMVPKRYVDESGYEHTTYEVCATTIEIITANEQIDTQ